MIKSLKKINEERKELQNEITRLVIEFQDRNNVIISSVDGVAEKVDVTAFGETESFVYGKFNCFVDVAFWLVDYD